MAATYMVRAMSSAEDDFAVFVDNSVVAVGWSKVDFTTAATVDAAVEAVTTEYYRDGKTAPQVAGKKRNEVRRFMNIKAGDRIIVPRWSGLMLATASGEPCFNHEAAGARDLGNQHRVQYLMDGARPRIIPRSALSEGLARRLRVRGSTISDLKEFEREVGRLFEGETYTSTLARMESEQEGRFKEQLLRVLQDGSSALATGGLGLERLVEELLIVDGYEAAVQSKRRYPGLADADVEASRRDQCVSVELLVQVKHHQGRTDTWGAEQLRGVVASDPDFFEEHQLVLVTTADATETLAEFCRENDITLITGHTLVDWIFDNQSKLSAQTRRVLRISNAPQLIPDGTT